MKKHIKIFSTALALSFFVGIANIAIAQPPPPPDDNTSGGGGNQLGGNAPIAGGLFILLGLGAAYGGKKLYDLKKEKAELEE